LANPVVLDDAVYAALVKQVGIERVRDDGCRTDARIPPGDSVTS
jgi:hypothetical protein